MKSLNRSTANVILISVLEILIGILLLINPIGFTSGIVIALGIGLAVEGVISIVEYFRTNAVEAALRGSLAKGLALLAAGIFCVLRPGWLIATFPLLTIVYGVAILFVGMYKVQWTVDALRMKTRRWFLPAISAAVSILCAVVILSNPFASTVAPWMFVAISLIVEAVLDLIVLLFSKIGAAGKRDK